MRGKRGLHFAVVVVMAFAVMTLTGCMRHNKLVTVVSSQGLVGGYALPGDTLTFTTLYPHDPGYVVHFVTTPYPCKDASGKPMERLPVTADVPGSCKVATAKGDQLAFFYEIELNGSSTVGSPGAAGSGSTGSVGNEHPSSAIPCRLCAVMGVGNGGSGSKNGKDLGADSHSTKVISCSDAGVATVGDAVVVAGDGASISWLGSTGDWTAGPFTPDPSSSNQACTNGKTISSSGTPTFCTLGDAGSYTYGVHLKGCATDGTGKLTIK